MVSDGNEVIQDFDNAWDGHVCSTVGTHKLHANSDKEERYPYCSRYASLPIVILGSLYSFAVLRDPNTSTMKT